MTSAPAVGVLLREAPTAPTAPGSRRRRFLDPLPSGRIVALDVARCVALVGMVVVHTSRHTDLSGADSWWFLLTSGRASALFALLAGVSLALMTGGPVPVRGLAARRRYVGLAVRALVIFVIGVAMAWHNPGILVILPVYAVLFWLVLPLLRLRARTLFVIAAAWMLIGPLLLFWAAGAGWPVGTEATNIDAAMVASSPLKVLTHIAISGPYPAVVWFAYVVLGAAVGRCDLRSWQVGAWLTGCGSVLVGAALTAARIAPSEAEAEKIVSAEYGHLVPQDGSDIPAAVLDKINAAMTAQLTGNPLSLLRTIPHSGTVGDVVNTAGSALIVIGVALLLVRTGFRVWAVLGGAGAMTLTLYVVHVYLAGLSGHVGGTLGAHPLRWNLAVVVATGMIFGLLGRSGPAEKAVSALANGAGRLLVRTPSSRARHSLPANGSRRAARRLN